MDEKLASYDITSAALQIESFTDELSNWYVRRNRERFWSQELTEEKIGAYCTLYKSINYINKKISAPFVPFITDEIYQKFSSRIRQRSTRKCSLMLMARS